MATVTFFRDFDFQISPTRLKAYLADHTYADVSDEIAQAAQAAGMGEIVPDDILNDDIPDSDLAIFEPKPARRKNRRSAWDR